MEWNGHKTLLLLKLPFLCASFPFQIQQNMLWYCNRIMATQFYAVRRLTRVRCHEITRKGIFRGLSCLSGLFLNARFYRLTVDCKSMLTTKRCNKKEKICLEIPAISREGGRLVNHLCLWHETTDLHEWKEREETKSYGISFPWLKGDFSLDVLTKLFVQLSGKMSSRGHTRERIT